MNIVVYVVGFPEGRLSMYNFLIVEYGGKGKYIINEGKWVCE